MARVLVTGGNGRLGRHIVARLQRERHHVTATFRSTKGPVPSVEWRQADVRSIETLEPLLEDCEAVIHLAAELMRPELMDVTNVDATVALLEAAQRKGVRYFGHASSIVVYGSPRQRRVDELTPIIDPLAPILPQYFAEPYMLDYARTKAAGELAIRRATGGLHIDIYRPAVIIEPEDIFKIGEWSKVRKILFAYRATQFITFEDAAAAIVHLMTRGLAKGNGTSLESYDIVDRTAGSYRALFATLYEYSQDRRFKVPLAAPMLGDMAKNALTYRSMKRRYPLGALKLSGQKLKATGFEPPLGYQAAVQSVLR